MTRLIADIGGTNVRFGLAGDKGIERVEVLSCGDFGTLAEAARAYLSKTGGKPETGAFAIAGPLDGTDRVSMTNLPWAFSIDETRLGLGLRTLKVVNDFAALAWGVPYLENAHLKKVAGGSAKKGAPVAIIGPGTGLGVAAVVFDTEGRPVPVATEGGHVTMPATTTREWKLFEYLRQTKYSHVSAERVVSGKGLANIYDALRGLDGVTNLPARTPPEVADAALNKSCPVCEEALDLFCHFLGVVAGNLALSLGAFGGVYIAGGIVPQLGDYFVQSRFYESFLAKGRFRDYLAPIPVNLVTHPYPGLEGLRRMA